MATSLSCHSEHLERSLSLESSLRTVTFIISEIGDKVFKHTKFSKVQLILYRNHCGISITKPWYEKRTWRFLSPLIHSWTSRIPVSSLDFKLKYSRLLSSLKKMKFSGSYKPCTHSHSPTPTHTQPKKVALTHTHPHPAKKRSHSPTLTHTQPKKVTPSHKTSWPPTHNWKKECHVSNTYVKIFHFHNISRCLQDLPVHLFPLNTFETAFESIVCLFVFNN